MRLTKLRLLGFKSFVEATDVLIEPGLTGIVGPNGCGKSNLVEALRWVMGESSHKNLRAAEMDDVIFAGSGNRPARNTAEVVLTVDNRDRTAPAAFNDADILEISRRIERDQGSNYRINGREVRARDVQLIFADASTGARSPALVRQGQIAELIAAKPQSRRRILEEAAGISGLHSRRHEAELRLKGAEQNLERLDDVIAQIDQQLESLRRQARQAAGYRSLSVEIRKGEAMLLHLSFEEAGRLVLEAERRLDGDLRRVAERTRAQSEAVRLAALAAHQLPALRETEATAASGLQRLLLAREALDADERRVADRRADLQRRTAQAEADRQRDTSLASDAASTLERLAAEEAQLAAEAEDPATKAAAAEGLSRANERANAAEEGLSAAQAAHAEADANRRQAERLIEEAKQRKARIERERAAIAEEQSRLAGQAGALAQLPALETALGAGKAAAEESEAAVLAAEQATALARAGEEAARPRLADAERRAARLETEVSTLEKLLAPEKGAKPSAASAVAVRPGFEAALVAALGDDLDAPCDGTSPIRWSGADLGAAAPALPEGARRLLDVVDAPGALAPRLAQVGVVDRADGPRLSARLAQGQRLVSREGDLWRWDGFVAVAHAASPAARRLAERNRLDALRDEARAAREAAAPLARAAAEAKARLSEAAEAEQAARSRAREAKRALDLAHERLSATQRAAATVSQRLAALQEAASRLDAQAADAEAAVEEAMRSVAAMPEPTSPATRLEAARREAVEARAALAAAQLQVQELAREESRRRDRLAAIVAERRSWELRRQEAEAHLEEIATREAELRAERDDLDMAPATLAARRRALLSEQSEAEGRRRDAADRLVEAETALAEMDRQSRDSLALLGKAREEQARSEERLDGVRARRAQVVREIEEAMSVAPAALLKLAGHQPDDRLPARELVERKVEAARQERDRLGAVNLRADAELSAVQAQHDGLVRERDDLIEAVKRLRQAISGLNREGRERLLTAFEAVNGHFQRLFATLFDGGTAELQLTESDDPLEAGLDMLARPPGKKPQTLSLLSGGEQALTALALIFAVFLTNPAPICVLDEVDAPLDDANVERFCGLLDEMTRLTQTRFVTITHNPITMARMNRLFGVTMAERGISQVVSVDLTEAETFREAS